MKIAIDTLFEHPERPTGATDYLRNVVRVLPKVGPENSYHLLASPRNIRHFQEFRQPGIHLVNCYVSNENMPLRIAVQQSLIPILMKRHALDVLFSPGNVCPLLGHFCRVLKINTMHHCHTPQLIGRVRSLYRRVAFYESAKKADHIIANTATTKQDICRFMDIPEGKVSVVTEAFYDVFAPVPSDLASKVTTRYGLRRPYLLFVSTLYPYKNVETLIRSLAHLVTEKGVDWELVIVGRDYDSQQPRLQSLARDLGVSERTRFLGFVPTDDLPALYSAAQAFVFPSLVETFGKPLVEAMRCGVPVIASNTSCIPEVLGNAGLLVNPLDSQMMARAIYQTIVNMPLRQDLIARGLLRAKQFSWGRGAKETLSVIEETFHKWRSKRR